MADQYLLKAGKLLLEPCVDDLNGGFNDTSSLGDRRIRTDLYLTDSADK
jgi:hypothetical protein